MKKAAAKASMTSMGKLGKNKLALPYRFSIGRVFSESLKKTYGAKLVYWQALGWIIIVNIGLSIVSSALAFGLGSVVENSLFVIAWLINAPLWVGLSYIGIRRSVNLMIDPKMIFRMYRFYWRIIAVRAIVSLLSYFAVGCITLGIFVLHHGNTPSAPIWMTILSVIACLLLVIIFYYIAFGFAFAALLVAEKNFGIIPALKASLWAFSQHWLKLIATYLLASLILILSVIPLGIPLIWTYPMIMNLHGVLYRIIFGVEEACS